MAGFLRQTAEALAELPQLLGHSIVPRLRLDARQWCTPREVVSTEVFNALLQGTVECGLSSRISIHKKKEHDGSQEEAAPEAGVTSDFCFDDSWTEKRPKCLTDAFNSHVWKTTSARLVGIVHIEKIFPKDGSYYFRYIFTLMF